MCGVGGGEGWVGERSTGHERGRKSKRKEDRAPRRAVSAVMRCHVPDIELSELGTVVGDGDDRLVGQVGAPPARVSGWGAAEVTGVAVVPPSRAGLARNFGWITCVWWWKERGMGEKNMG